MSSRGGGGSGGHGFSRSPFPNIPTKPRTKPTEENTHDEGVVGATTSKKVSSVLSKEPGGIRERATSSQKVLSKEVPDLNRTSREYFVDYSDSSDSDEEFLDDQMNRAVAHRWVCICPFSTSFSSLLLSFNYGRCDHSRLNRRSKILNSDETKTVTTGYNKHRGRVDRKVAWKIKKNAPKDCLCDRTVDAIISKINRMKDEGRLQPVESFMAGESSAGFCERGSIHDDDPFTEDILSLIDEGLGWSDALYAEAKKQSDALYAEAKKQSDALYAEAKQQSRQVIQEMRVNVAARLRRV